MGTYSEDLSKPVYFQFMRIFMTIQFCEFFSASVSGIFGKITQDKAVLEQNEQVLEEEIEDSWLCMAKRIEDRVASILVQCQRFEAITEELRQQPDSMDIEMAATVLEFPGSSLLETERALVFLAMTASDESGQLIKIYTPPQNSTDLCEFHPIVKIEWEKRYACCHSKAE